MYLRIIVDIFQQISSRQNIQLLLSVGSVFAHLFHHYNNSNFITNSQTMISSATIYNWLRSYAYIENAITCCIRRIISTVVHCRSMKCLADTFVSVFN